jgi:chemotaxis protein MotB
MAAIIRQRVSLSAAGAANDELGRLVATRDGALRERDKKLADLEKNLTALQTARAADKAALDELADLQRERDAATARNAELSKFVAQFQKLVDAGKLAIEVRHGRLVLVMPNDVLFDEGRTAIKSGGHDALDLIAKTLATLPGRTFQIVGHTDTTPIKTKAFPSNWELSSTRALAVVKLLLEDGVPGNMLAATGRGEWEPIAPNGTAYGRAKNRRIEIVLEPQMGDLLKLSQLKM